MYKRVEKTGKCFDNVCNDCFRREVSSYKQQRRKAGGTFEVIWTITGKLEGY